MSSNTLFTSVRLAARRIYTAVPAFFHVFRFLAPGYYRGKRSARAYAGYYATARALFSSTGTVTQQAAIPLHDVTAHRIFPAKPGDAFSIQDAAYPDKVARVARQVEKLLDEPGRCLFFPQIKSKSVARTTGELPEIQQGEVITIQLADYDGIEGLEELCGSILEALEKSVYRCHVVADKVYVYRNLVSTQPEQVSWLWHYDNHPNEIVKVMVYLTDVDETTGPFEYLISSTTGRPLKMSPVPGLGRPFLDTRISPQQIARYAAQGFAPSKLIGPRGTTCLFSENIVHKANIAKTRPRDVLIIQVRPVAFRSSSYISRQWTGSFQHLDVGLDPAHLAPIPKPRMASG